MSGRQLFLYHYLTRIKFDFSCRSKELSSNRVFQTLVNGVTIKKERINSKLLINTVVSSSTECPISISNSVLKKAAVLVSTNTEVSVQDSTKLIPSFLSVLELRNAGVRSKIELHPDGSMERFAVVFSGAKASMPYLKNLLGLDAAAFKDLNVAFQKETLAKLGATSDPSSILSMDKLVVALILEAYLLLKRQFSMTWTSTAVRHYPKRKRHLAKVVIEHFFLVRKMSSL